MHSRTENRDSIVIRIDADNLKPMFGFWNRCDCHLSFCHCSL